MHGAYEPAPRRTGRLRIRDGTGSDESFARLHAAGWTVGDVAVHGECGAVSLWLTRRRLPITGASEVHRLCRAADTNTASGRYIDHDFSP
jgi:hypothetical protein